MKIAVAFSGLIRGNYQKNITKLKEKLPMADFWFTTWKGQQEESFIHKYYDEPVINYNPATEISYPQTYQRFLRGPAKNWQDRSKQILAHCLVVHDFCTDYDVIVRARYDCAVSEYTNLYDYCKMTYDTNKSIGFFTPRNSRDPGNLTQVTHGDRYFQHHVDHMIIHKKSLLHIDLAWKLHHEKQLRVAEYGWWQVLSEPNGDNHLAFRGGVKLD